MSAPTNPVNTTATVGPDAAEADGLTDLGTSSADGVILRRVPVALASDVGGAFISDCARHIERLLTDDEIKDKWELSEEDWAGLADNAPLLQAVRAERERRICNGDAAKEAAQRHFAKAPTVLGDILTNELVSPRHRIEAARELRQAAAGGETQDSASQEKFIIQINLGGGEKPLIYEKDRAPIEPQRDGRKQ
jgi:hypothetical protein